MVLVEVKKERLYKVRYKLNLSEVERVGGLVFCDSFALLERAFELGQVLDFFGVKSVKMSTCGMKGADKRQDVGVKLDVVAGLEHYECGVKGEVLDDFVKDLAVKMEALSSLDIRIDGGHLMAAAPSDIKKLDEIVSGLLDSCKFNR